MTALLPSKDTAIQLAETNGWALSFLPLNQGNGWVHEFELGSIVKVVTGHSALKGDHDTGRVVRETKCYVWVLCCATGTPQKKLKTHLEVAKEDETPLRAEIVDQIETTDSNETIDRTVNEVGKINNIEASSSVQPTPDRGENAGGERGGTFDEATDGPAPEERLKVHSAKCTIPIEKTEDGIAGAKSDAAKPRINPFDATPSASKLAAWDPKAINKRAEKTTNDKEVVETKKSEEPVDEPVTVVTKEEYTNFGTNEEKTQDEKNDEEKIEKKGRRASRERRHREPKVVNSRAALLGQALAATSVFSTSREVSYDSFYCLI